MPVEKPFTMPKLGATMTEGTVLALALPAGRRDSQRGAAR